MDCSGPDWTSLRDHSGQDLNPSGERSHTAEAAHTGALRSKEAEWWGNVSKNMTGAGQNQTGVPVPLKYWHTLSRTVLSVEPGVTISSSRTHRRPRESPSGARTWEHTHTHSVKLHAGLRSVRSVLRISEWYLQSWLVNSTHNLWRARLRGCEIYTYSFLWKLFRKSEIIY